MSSDSDDDVQCLITKLCVILARDADPGGTRAGNVSVKELRKTAFSILLKVGEQHRQVSDGKPWDVPVEDRVVAKAIEMQLKSRHQDALRLRACLSKLRGASGRCSDGVQACLEFLLCLSETRPAKPSVGRRLFELPSIMEPSYQARHSVCLVPGVPAFKDYSSELFERIDDLSKATSKASFLPALCAVQPGFDLNGNPLFGSFGRRRAVGGTSENERSFAGSLPRIAPLNALTRNTVVGRRFNEARSTKPDVFSGAHPREEEVHVGQKTVQQSSKTNEDIWESVLRSKSRRHFTWETLGCVGVSKEEPFLTEAGQEAAEATQQFCLQLSSIVLGSETDSAVVDQSLLVRHIVQLLAGIPSDYFPYDAFVGRFVVKKGIRLSGMSSEALAPMLSEFESCGAKVRFLDTISSPPSEPGATRRCLTLAAFREGLRRYLHHYRGALLPMTEHLDSLTVMQLHHLTNGLREQIGFLANFCVMEVQMSGSGEEGMRLLGRLQRKAEEVRGQQGYIVMVFLLQHACRPYLGFLQDWLFNGICNDQYGEFPIQLNEESAVLRDAEFWESSFALRFGGDSAEEVPFLDDCLDDAFKCAKATMLLKVCRPQTPLFRKGTDRPTLRLAFTGSKLAEIEAASQRYLEDTGRELELGVLPRLRPGHFPGVEIPEEWPKPWESGVRVEEKLRLYSVPRSPSSTLKKHSISLSQDTSAQPSEGSETAPGLICSVITGTHMAVGGRSHGRRAEESEHVEHGLYCNETGTYMKPARRSAHGHASRSQLGQILYPDLDLDKGGYTERMVLEAGAGEPVPGSGFKDVLESCRSDATAAEVETSEGMCSNTEQNRNVHDAEEDDTSKAGERLAESMPDSHTDGSEEIVSSISQTSAKKIGIADNGGGANEIGDESDDDAFDDEDMESNQVEDSRDDVSCGQEPRTSSGPTQGQGGGDMARWAEGSRTPYVATTYRWAFPECVQEPFPSNLFPLADHEPDEESLADWSQDSGFDRLPLEVVLKRSLLPPLTAQIRLVDRTCVTFLIKDLGLYAHLEALSNFFCFQDGEFGQGFCDALGRPLRSPVDFLNPATLNGVLQHALHSSLRGDTPEASNLSLDARRIPSAIAPGQNILSCLVLKYKIDWPLNIVITSPCLLRYNKIFGFLLYIRRTQWALFDIWCNLKPSALPRNPHGSPQFQQLQLMRHEMQQFVQLLQGYVGGQVMQTSLAELQDDLDRQVRNVDDLRNTHLLFLKRLSQRLLLARRATPVAKLLREALRTVLLFQAELSAQSWLIEGGELRHPAFRRFQHAHTKFRQTVNLLLTTLTSWEELQCRQSCFKLSSVLGSTAFLWPDAVVHGQDVGGSPSEAQMTPSDCSGVSSIACNLSF
ncbi:hypothetical protein HPB47_016586 [Ixodes persulcatus]|uniref:Uncharacterized protein n=1 Tax=Ixodes persulcatus TaxID=34615 RepID=A0AC60QQM1_IXOPE|nr:hypothetical protein HPB47_016586 [Ixodes persulcatus]